VSEQILNGTSTQLGYTGYSRWMFWRIQDRRQIKNTDNTQIQLRKMQHKIQHNKTSLVQSHLTTLSQ